MSEFLVQCSSCGQYIEAKKGLFALKKLKCSCGETLQLRDVHKQIKKESIMNEASIIKYEGNNNTLVWKHPIEDFNYGSQLIVHESQEALFFKDGKALDLFGAGRYTLETQNLPILEKSYTALLGENTSFHAEIYFINQTILTGIKWGTDSKVRLFDPVSGMYLEIGASGEFYLRVCNSRKLILKLVGTTSLLNGTDLLNGYFKPLIMTRVKTYLAQTIKQQAINILEIDEQLTRLSEALKEQINESLFEYGLEMPEFYVMRVVTPDDDINFKRMKQQYADQYLNIREEQIKKEIVKAATERQIVETEAEAQIKMIQAQGDAAAYKIQAEAEAFEMKVKDYTYAQETARQVGLSAMKNGITGGEGGSTTLGDLAGLGITLGTMGGIMGMTKDVIHPIVDSVNATVSGNSWRCVCGNQAATGNFCSNCGKPRTILDEQWTCKCGQKDLTSRFCSNCGSKKGE